ncbi:hypothetical protein [Sphingomonas sp.]|uniref:hypothetical protein n=1 Tax=Sphingomonas sp. TaxID=28214 RepID=UPI001B19CD2F|nr:hypothetical protein [Sphingomonas sp.]MBO9711328.1 hypothetical protein [Sphingomonas sp.]
MLGWREHHIGPRNDRYRIEGVDVWREKWRWINGQTVYLPNPFRPGENARCMICEIGGKYTGMARFAASELENGLWVFYVPE